MTKNKEKLMDVKKMVGEMINPMTTVMWKEDD